MGGSNVSRDYWLVAADCIAQMARALGVPRCGVASYHYCGWVNNWVGSHDPDPDADEALQARLNPLIG